MVRYICTTHVNLYFSRRIPPNRTAQNEETWSCSYWSGSPYTCSWPSDPDLNGAKVPTFFRSFCCPFVSTRVLLPLLRPLPHCVFRIWLRDLQPSRSFGRRLRPSSPCHELWSGNGFFVSVCFCYHLKFFLVVISLSGKREIWICVFEALEWQFWSYLCSRSSKTGFLVQICGVLESCSWACVGV